MKKRRKKTKDQHKVIELLTDTTPLLGLKEEPGNINEQIS